MVQLIIYFLNYVFLLLFFLFFYINYLGAFLIISTYKFSKYESRKVYPKVSVIIPTRNEEDVIEKTLRNLRNSNYPDLEIILVDSSDDRTKEIAKKYADKIIVAKDTKGKPNALNIGVRKASGKIVYFLDSDSLCDRDTIKKLISYLDEDSVCVGINVPVNKNNFISRIGRLNIAFMNSMWLLGEKVMKTTLIPGKNFAIHRKLLLDIGGFKNVLTEDVNLTFRLHKAGKKIKLIEAYSYEQVPERLSWYLKQQQRWLAGGFSEIYGHIKDSSIKRSLAITPASLLLIFSRIAVSVLTIISILTWNILFFIPVILIAFIMLSSVHRFLDKSDYFYFPFTFFSLVFLQIGVAIYVLLRKVAGKDVEWYKTPKKKY